MVRFVDRGGVMVISHSLDVGMNSHVVEVSGVASVKPLFPLKEGVRVIIILAFFAGGVSSFMDNGEAFDLSESSEEREERSWLIVEG